MEYTLCILTGTYNRLALLQAFVASVRADVPRGVAYYFCVADGGSTDGTLEWLRDQADVRLIEQGELLGGIRAYTEAGETITDAKYTLIGNDDIEILPGSIPAALVHLESTPTCGGVAFYTDQPLPGRPAGSFNIQHHPKHGGGGLPYAQVGIFPTWMAHAADWWSYRDPSYGAYHYGADNILSSKIQEFGYTIDPVRECRYHDELPPDPLRVKNVERAEDDARRYFARFPGGVRVPDAPQIEPPDDHVPQLRVLYLPIYEPQHPHQYDTKRGLRDALAESFLVWEYAYTLRALDRRPDERREVVRRELMEIVQRWQPHLILAQIHDTQVIDADTLASVRALVPRAMLVSWNGDVWAKGLTSPEVLKMLRYVDVQLVVNASVLDEYAAHGIPAAYWQIGYEPPVGELPKAQAHPVVFLGNNYSKERGDLYAALVNAGIDCAFYGEGWHGAAGSTLYDFAAGEAIYRKAVIAIGDSQFPNAHGFVSNRLFQVLGAGGALLLHQTVNGLDELTGIRAGEHYIEWSDFDDLVSKIRYWLDRKQAKARRQMVAAAQQEIQARHTFAARVDELFAIIRMKRSTTRRIVRLSYRLPRESMGVRLRDGRHVEYKNGALAVSAEDAAYLMRTDENWIEVEAAL